MLFRFHRYATRHLTTANSLKHSSTDNYDFHYKLNSPKSVAIQREEGSVLRKFQNDNRDSISKSERLISRCSGGASDADKSSADICGPYEYYDGNDGTDSSKCHAMIFRRLRANISSIKKDSHQEQHESLVLDANQLMSAIPNMVTISRMKPSLDHSVVAFSVDLEFGDATTLYSNKNSSPTRAFYLKHVAKNIICEIDIIEAVTNVCHFACPSIVDFEWAVDTLGDSVLYLVLDDHLLRPSIVKLFNVGTLSHEIFPISFYTTKSETPALHCFKAREEHLIEIVLERDEAFNIDIARSKDDKYIIISSQSKVSSEVYLVPIPVPASLGPLPPTLPMSLAPRQRGLKYYVDHSGGSFYVATNRPYRDEVRADVPTGQLPFDEDSAADLAIIRCSSAVVMGRPADCTATDRDRRAHPFTLWHTIYPVEKEGKEEGGNVGPGPRIRKQRDIISDFDIFQEKMVVYGRSGGLPSVHILDLKGSNSSGDARWPSVTDLTGEIRTCVGSDVFRIIVGMNAAVDSAEARLSVSSPLVPEMRFAINLKSGVLSRSDTSDTEGMQRSEQMGKIASKYTVVTENATSEDGTVVPITLVCRNKKPVMADQAPPGPRPLVLVGYGAYGMCVPTEFDPQVMALLERGFSVGYAHCRGGGEFGASWHAAGKGMNKCNTFRDFAACARHLIERGYTSAPQLCAVGTSAGGLIMGAMANHYAHLFAALIMRHPFLDPYETLQRPELPLTVHEYDEFGSPHDPEALGYLQSYSPCSNIGGHVYPAMFLSTGLHDTRVGAWEVLKWVQMLRAKQRERLGGTESSPAQFRNRGRTPADHPPIVLHITRDCGHNGPSDSAAELKIKAAEIVFMENAVKSRRTRTS